MTHVAPHPGFLPGERVTLQHPTQGTLRLVVHHTRPLTADAITPQVVMTDANGLGCYRYLATDLTRGWGD